MSNLDFIVDDLKVAKTFIGTLPNKLVRSRFSRVAEWNPTHIVLASKDGRVVAMADCVRDITGSGANGSLLAAPKCGAYAVHCLLHMKRIFPTSHWLSTLRNPTSPTVAVSRRYFDTTYDQGTWEVACKLMEEHGSQSHLAPTPIVVSTKTLGLLGIPPIRLLNTPSRNQLLRAASDPSKTSIKAPNGSRLDGPTLMSLAFELLSTPMRIRQDVTRLMMLSLAAAHGHYVDPSDLHAKPESMSVFFESVRQASKASDFDGGVFTTEQINEDYATSFQNMVAAGKLPSDRQR